MADMSIRKEVLERVLFCKYLLSKYQSHPGSYPDRIFLAEQLMVAHDAAEFAIAAIAEHVGKLPARDKQFLMDYFEPIKELHPDRDVSGKEYFRRLNRARVDIKHYGILPDPRQWGRVGETVYGYVNDWCRAYLKIPLDELDEGALLIHEQARAYYENAKAALSKTNYREVFEELAKGQYVILLGNPALRGLQIGPSRPETAIRLTGFGVHANDYLALQEFLPQVEEVNGEPTVTWKQAEFGHPANWQESEARFCLATFLDVALKIQHAQWVPGAIPFELVYQYKVTALGDQIDVWADLPPAEAKPDVLGVWMAPPRREKVHTLGRHDSFFAFSAKIHAPRSTLFSLQTLLGSAASAEPSEGAELVELAGTTIQPIGISVLVRRKDVRVTCVPKSNRLVTKYFPWLPEVEWVP